MKRIEAAFAALRARGETALLPYLTVGYPSRGATAELGAELVRAGADGLELGIPFSDPLADGATLQRVSQRALESGVTLDDAFATARALRAVADVPLVFMSYYNPVQRRGVAEFCAAAAEGGVEGLMVPVLPFDETESMLAACVTTEVCVVVKLAWTLPGRRVEAACEEA